MVALKVRSEWVVGSTCDGHARVSRENAKLKRKRKKTNKILLGKTATVGHPSFAKVCLVLQEEMRVFNWMWDPPENCPWATAPSLTDRG